MTRDGDAIAARWPISPGVRALNAALFDKALAPLLSEKLAGAPVKAPGKRRKEMNQTEADFARILDAKVRRGDIVSYEYEGITLRWGKLDNIQYTPDFVVFVDTHPGALTPGNYMNIKFIEVKGGKIWPKDIQKFKQARNEWPLFGFEMHQKKDRTWAQLY